MKKIDNKRKIHQQLKEEMTSDRSRHTILPLSKFGLMQITRQRVRPEMNIITRESCPSCGGTGKISASILVADKIEETINHIFIKQNEKKLTVCLHPYLFAYFTKGIISQRTKWFFKYGKWVNLVEDSSLAITEFNFININGEMIEV